jgi:hypothetical protein
MSHRKHLTEMTLGFCSAGVLLLHPKGIKNLDKEAGHLRDLIAACHIYLVVKRPRVTYVPGSFVIAGPDARGKVQFFRNGQKKTSSVAFYLQGRPSIDSTEVSGYPHNNLVVKSGGRVFCEIPAHLMVMGCSAIEDQTLRQLEVVYVGMAYGDGTRSAKDRLANHATLQQVLADLNHDYPDDEALIVMAEYAPPQAFICIDGSAVGVDPADDRDVIDDVGRLGSELPEIVRIALIEAGLIRYFQPEYNEKYKESFPRRDHKILEAVYAIDFIGLGVELNTMEIGARLFSPSRRAGAHHIANYDLHDPNDRESFFATFGSDAKAQSGPFL